MSTVSPHEEAIKPEQTVGPDAPSTAVQDTPSQGIPTLEIRPQEAPQQEASQQEKSQQEAPAKPNSGYIAGPWYENFFLIFSPVWALGVGAVVAAIAYGTDKLLEIAHGAGFSQKVTMNAQAVGDGFIGTFIMAHLFLVFFRSHLNTKIFKLYPLRFTVVPIVLFVAMMSSIWVSVCVAILATWWDVYHSSCQTFGISRIYDMKAGNDPDQGRDLDWVLNLVLYCGPILAGATLMAHVNDFNVFGKPAEINQHPVSLFFTSIPAQVEGVRLWLTLGVFCVGIPFLIYYVFRYYQFYKQGYKVSFQKVALLVSTAICSVVAWGFNSFGEAFFIVNFFHALQYFALVWWTEKKNLTKMIGGAGKSWGPIASLGLLLVVAFGYGIWADQSNSDYRHVAYSFIMVIAIMHFWYDGFIWSVRKKQV